MFQLGMLTSSWRGPMTSLLAVKQSQGNKLKQGYIVWSGVKKKKSVLTLRSTKEDQVRHFSPNIKVV